MPNYDTTADDFASSGNDVAMWENIDGTTLLKEGWRPGKKHSFLQNVARVGSLGIYNPDDRAASAVNKKIMSQHGLNQESFNQVKQAHSEEIEQRTNDIMSWDPNIPRPEARKLAIEMFTTQYFAEIAANRANTSQDRVRDQEMQGREPGSKEFGAGAVAADTAANRARGAQMRNIETGESTMGALQVPESRAQVASGEAVTKNMQLQDQQSAITDKRLQYSALKPFLERQAAAEAQQGATSAEARAGLWNSPFAKDLAQFEENKRLAIQTPPLGTTAVPFTGVMANKVLGQDRPLSRVNEYKTTDRRFDEAGRPMGWSVRERTRGSTTADTNAPVAAPPMTPMVPPKQGLRMTPEQFKALFNAQ